MTNQEPIDLGPVWSQLEQELATPLLAPEQIRQLLRHVYWLERHELAEFYGETTRAHLTDYVLEKWDLLQKNPLVWMLDLDQDNFKKLIRDSRPLEVLEVDHD